MDRHLIGYDDWPFEHVKVKVVGYAVLDKSCLLDLQPDEVVYTDTTNSWLRDDMIGSMGDESIPVLQPAEPTDISRYVHWADKNWSYNGSYDNRYDPALKSLDRRQPACDFLPCLRKIYARKSAYYLRATLPKRDGRL